MTIEAKYGVPTVAMHTDKFDRVVRSVAAVNGMAELRQVFVPQPVMGKSARELRAYVDGKDPLTGRPVMQEVIEGLTAPPSGEGGDRIEYDRSTPRLVEPDSEESLHRLFMESRWTDYLPIVLPTEERVAAMLAATRRKPDEIVGRMRPTHFREAWQYTVEKVAVNAVMAGARPEYFSLILALAATGVSARGSTTSSMAAMAVVNGPIRLEIKMNAGTGAPTACSRRTSRVARCPDSPTWARRGTTTLTTASRSPRTRSGAPGSRSTSSTGSVQPTVPSASSRAAAPPPTRLGSASSTGATTSATCCAGWIRTSRRSSCSIRSPRGSSSTAAGSPRRTR